MKRESVVVGAAPCLGQSLSFEEARAYREVLMAERRALGVTFSGTTFENPCSLCEH